MLSIIMIFFFYIQLIQLFFSFSFLLLFFFFFSPLLFHFFFCILIYDNFYHFLKTNQHAKQVLCLEQFRLAFLAKNCVNIGFSTFVYHITNSYAGLFYFSTNFLFNFCQLFFVVILAFYFQMILKK